MMEIHISKNEGKTKESTITEHTGNTLTPWKSVRETEHPCFHSIQLYGLMNAHMCWY